MALIASSRSQKPIRQQKIFDLTAGQVFKIIVDNVEDTDWTYTVPTGQKAKIVLVLKGVEESIIKNH